MQRIWRLMRRMWSWGLCRFQFFRDVGTYFTGLRQYRGRRLRCGFTCWRHIWVHWLECRP